MFFSPFFVQIFDFSFEIYAHWLIDCVWAKVRRMGKLRKEIVMTEEETEKHAESLKIGRIFGGMRACARRIIVKYLYELLTRILFLWRFFQTDSITVKSV